MSTLAGSWTIAWLMPRPLSDADAVPPGGATSEITLGARPMTPRLPTCSVPEAGPSTVGLKDTFALQDAPPARVLPQSVDWTVKSPIVVTVPMLIGFVLGLVIENVCGGPRVPFKTLPKTAHGGGVFTPAR